MSGTLTVLSSFSLGAGYHPQAGIIDVGGTLYGTTPAGGTSSDGTVFSYTLGATQSQTLINFTGSTGAAPGNLPLVGVTDVGGILYGATEDGGTYSRGVLFSFNPATATYTDLIDFNPATAGAVQPQSDLVAANGTLYGTTGSGGSGFYGTLFSYVIATAARTTLVNFNGSGNGAVPLAGVIDVAGTLYGTTSNSGSAGNGTLFSYNLATSAFQTLASFGSTNGAVPRSDLLDVGTTASGGTGDYGTIFSYDIAAATFTTLASFNYTDGDDPLGTLADINGTIYGTTFTGGSNSSAGVLFAYDITTGTLTDVENFDTTNGSYPEGGVIAVGNTLYGTTQQGGANNEGEIFSYTPACFAEGTTIATAAGPVAVERLRPGDLVATLSGRLAPVRWLGHRRLDLTRHARPADVMPVRVRAGAFGPEVPTADLVLSPDHAVFVEGHLVPIRHLVNGISIEQERRTHVTYWHVELDRHDVLLAEGLVAESYLDTGNRNAFAGAEALTLHPDFAPSHARTTWQARGCAPILTDPAALDLRRIHTSLLAIAAGDEPPIARATA